MPSIIEEYEEKVIKLKERHRKELKELEEELEKSQAQCGHNWEGPFHVFDCDCPFVGERCSECGLTRRITYENMG